MRKNEKEQEKCRAVGDMLRLSDDWKWKICGSVHSQAMPALPFVQGKLEKSLSAGNYRK